ncbi:MAG: aconitase/3-isopropylmalate dehydratase large subunit family protein [Alphaproteobacteria bacterium]
MQEKQAPDPLAERILGARLGRPVRPGEIVAVEVDRIMAHDGSGPTAARALERHGIGHLRGAERAVIVFDHYYPPASEREAELHSVARAFAAQYGIPVLAGVGISHQVLPERGLLAPGTVFVGGDSHSCTAGAFGVLGIGLGATDVAGVLASGHVWLEVPETVRIRLEGSLGPGVGGQDLILHILGLVGTSGALGKAVEFVGPAIEGLEIADRMKLANHTVEMGAVAGLVGVDSRCLAWLEDRGADVSQADVAAHDPVGDGADFEVHLDQVEPLIALPSRPDQVAPLGTAPDAKVDQVFIGSCAGGRLEDLRVAARVLDGEQIHPGLRLLIGPASAEVLDAAMADGTLGILLKAGATLLPPGCGACLGRLGTLGAGEVAVATQNRNFVGRAGSSSSRLYLASPATAARAALTGRIPRETAS